MKKVIVGIMMVFGLMAASTGSAQEMIQIKGSDTLINLVQRLAEVYMEENPGSYIAVTGGGSGTGIAALINQKCDIANSSRLMKPKELTMAADNGVTAKRVVIAVDGLSVIVNNANPVNKLTKDQVGAIFRGDIKDWRDVGGTPGPITMYGRQSNSGTFVFFQDYILKGDYSGKMNRMNGNAQIMEAVKADPNGIGYVGVGYIKDDKSVQPVSVATRPGEEYANPLDTEAVKSGRYPISRPLNQYVSGNLSGNVKEFIEFELSEKGQKVVEEEGFFSVPQEYIQFNQQSVGI